MSEPGNPVGAKVALVLTAHAAARALGRRIAGLRLKRSLPRRARLARDAFSRRPAWTPLLLRWARHGAAPAAAGSRAAAHPPAIAAGPAPQFHWHIHLASPPAAARALREARPTACAGTFRTLVQAGGIHQRRSSRLADTVERRVGGPTFNSEAAGAIGPVSLPARPGWSSAPVQNAVAGATMRSTVWRTARTAATFGWIERAAAQARGVHWPADSRSAHLPGAPTLGHKGVAGRDPTGAIRWMSKSVAPRSLIAAQAAHASPRQSDPMRRRLAPDGPAFGLGRASDRLAAAESRMTSPSVTPRQQIGNTAAMTSPIWPIGRQAHAGPNDLPQHSRSQLTRTWQWTKRAQLAAGAFATMRPPAAWRHPGEQAWRARDPAAAAPGSSRRTVAPGTVTGSAMQRPVDLVWQAASASAAPPAVTTHVGAGAVAGAPSRGSALQVPAAGARSSGNAVAGATALDPVLANRLADEVMRRIDLRARIARERRGL